MLFNGDCLEVLKPLTDNSVDSLVTDPPAGIAFMGKEWDKDKGGRKEWCAWLESVMRECLRVMKPGAHGLVWSLPRTAHWTATALEDAGFDVRDCITHLFGSGFPKSLNISKAIDKAAGAKREVVGKNGTRPIQTSGRINAEASAQGSFEREDNLITSPTTDAAKQWDGFGTALKPAAEFWWLVRKPISEKTVAANVLKWGVGGLNIDATRISSCKDGDSSAYNDQEHELTRRLNILNRMLSVSGCEPCVELNLANVLLCVENLCKVLNFQFDYLASPRSYGALLRFFVSDDQGIFPSQHDVHDDMSRLYKAQTDILLNRDTGRHAIEDVFHRACESYPILILKPQGRFPSNLVFSHSPHCTDDQCDLECAVEMLNGQTEGYGRSNGNKTNNKSGHQDHYVGGKLQKKISGPCYSDKGNVSRFFYCAKVSPSERNAGCEDMGDKRRSDARPNSGDLTGKFPDHDNRIRSGNHHPTVKPLKLMRYLCRLITPPQGIILDPFMGSGSTGLAAKQEGFGFIGIEREQEYFEISKIRIEHSY